MKLFPPHSQEPSSTLENSVLQLPQQACDRIAVIENDWVPAIQHSQMHCAVPVSLAGPLRPMWYVANAKNLLLKVVRSKRQTV